MDWDIHESYRLGRIDQDIHEPSGYRYGLWDYMGWDAQAPIRHQYERRKLPQVATQSRHG